MNRLILVGNGFDLYLGLKTDYPSLLSKALYKIINNSKPFDRIKLMNANKNEIAQIKKSYKNSMYDFFNKLLELKNNNKIKIKSRFLEELLCELHSNKCKWCDYETTMIKASSNCSLKFSSNNGRVSNYKCNNCELKSIKLLNKYVIDEIKSENIQKSKIKNYNERVNEIVKILNLDEEKENINKTLICNFNFTDTFEDVAKQIKYEGDILYIHGSLKNCSDCEFGYYYDSIKWRGEKSETHYDSKGWEKKPYDFLTKCILHMDCCNKRQNKSEDKILKEFTSLDDFELLIIGLSCGDSDGLILYRSIFTEKCYLIKLIIHVNDKGKDNYQKIKDTITNGIGSDFDSNKIMPIKYCYKFPNYKNL